MGRKKVKEAKKTKSVSMLESTYNAICDKHETLTKYVEKQVSKDKELQKHITTLNKK